jgi:hypothetical protein
LIDVAAVTSQLWHCVFRSRFQAWLADRLGVDADSCARWLAFRGGAHDIGKAAPCFQDRNNQSTVQLKAVLKPDRFSFYGRVCARASSAVPTRLTGLSRT